MRAQWALLLAGLAPLTGGCVAGSLAAASVGVAVVQDRTLGRAVDDTAATTEIRGRLLSTDRTTFFRVDVEVTSGQALLTGSVPSLDNKLAAERIAWESTGVRSVTNQIEIGPRGGFGRTALDKLITERIRVAFLHDSSVKGLNYNIETHKGVVYLLGVARTEAELQRSAEIAARTAGVQRVVTYVTVRQPRLPAGAAYESAEAMP